VSAPARCFKPLSYNLSVTPGFATAEATVRFVSRFARARDRGFYRPVNGLEVSSLGFIQLPCNLAMPEALVEKLPGLATDAQRA
jgi:hypothetical protein